MGIYLNRGNGLLAQARKSAIYIDKSGILTFLNSVIGTEQKYVCISRPRRFGKSMAANMISAFYDRSCSAEKDFSGMAILQKKGWQDHANQYNVLFLNMQNFLSQSRNVDQLLERLQRKTARDLLREYPDIDYYDPGSLPDIMEEIYATTNIPFVIIIDEWDCLFREYKSDKAAQKQYLDFLRLWLKDREYVGLCYMTGILPIKKYGSHSALNMFSEFSMENPRQLAAYVGFTEEETKGLCQKYHMDFSECQAWYDGYSFVDASHIYSPKSVVDAMLSGIFDDYWNKTESYEALRIYIDMNFDGLRDAIISMMAGSRVKINTGSFQNDMTTFSNADDVLTLLIHLGYLGYDFARKEVYIPNQEILSEFVTATSVSQWNEVISSVRNSDQLLKDTLNGNEAAVAAGIQRAHLETSHIQYNDENALSYTVSLAYYAARQYYTIIRELPTGNGCADLTFIPRRQYADMPAMIIELKWNEAASVALDQIQNKRYPHALKDYQGKMLLVGISYDRKTREHQCRIEKLPS